MKPTKTYRCSKGHVFEAEDFNGGVHSFSIGDGPEKWCIRCLIEKLREIGLGVVKEVLPPTECNKRGCRQPVVATVTSNSGTYGACEEHLREMKARLFYSGL